VALNQLLQNCAFGCREPLEPCHMLTMLAEQNVGGAPDPEAGDQGEIA
jgi:hypothetical protein